MVLSRPGFKGWFRLNSPEPPVIGCGENSPIRPPPAQPSAFGIGLRQELDRLGGAAGFDRSLSGLIKELGSGGDLDEPPDS